MAKLRDQAKAAVGQGNLRQAAKQHMVADQMQLNHPTMDSPEASARQTYVPPMPQDRFKFLRDFATKPGLRAKAGGETSNR